MQPTAIAVRPPYQHRLHHGRAVNPRRRAHGVPSDPLAPARGVMNGVILSAALWAGIIAVLTRFFG
jgi:hypothetical protein